MQNIDLRKSNKVLRFKPIESNNISISMDDSIPEYMNVLGMIFSMAGLMMRLKWCAWIALLCSCVSFTNIRVHDDAKQIVSSFMLSISAVVMSYLQNPSPIIPPWTSIF